MWAWHVTRVLIQGEQFINTMHGNERWISSRGDYCFVEANIFTIDRYSGYNEQEMDQK
jgi:hypothetical protein